MTLNYEKLLSFKIRNADCLFHDVCKVILMSLLKKKHKNTEIYSEYNPDFPNSSYPDIFMRIKERVYIFELQKEINSAWLEQISDKYNIKNYDLIIVDLKKLPRDFDKLVEKLKEFVI